MFAEGEGVGSYRPAAGRAGLSATARATGPFGNTKERYARSAEVPLKNSEPSCGPRGRRANTDDGCRSRDVGLGD